MSRAVAVHRDVVFASPPGYRPLCLDLYVPEGSAGALCLYLHGGGWRIGSRRDGPGPAASWTPSFFERLAGMGLAVASLDYRLSGEVVFPAQLHDVTAAAEFLAAKRADFGVGTPRTVAWGVSAGGHLAAMYALTATAHLPAVAPGRDDSTPVGAVACWYPPTDLDALADDADEAGGRGDRGPQARESQLVGSALASRPDLARAASPVQFAHAAAPPFLLIHGTADVLVPPRQSQRLASALTAAGARATVELVPGAGHMFPELDDTATTQIVRRTVNFLLDTSG